jgi:hypothetical protein
MIAPEFLQNDHLFNGGSKWSELFYLAPQNFVAASNGEIAPSISPVFAVDRHPGNARQ